MNSIGQLWHPIWLLWWTVIGLPIHAVLQGLLSFLNGNPVAQAIGPFGIAWNAPRIAIGTAPIPCTAWASCRAPQRPPTR